MIWDLVALFGLLMGLAIFFELIRANMRQIVEANPRMRQARVDLEEATREARAHIAQMRDAEKRKQELEDAITLVKSRIEKAERTIDEIRPTKPVLIKELGKPLKNNFPFDAVVTNRFMRFAKRPTIIEKLNPIWGRPTDVVAWAPNRVDAKRLIETEFPADMGFEIDLGRAFKDVG